MRSAPARASRSRTRSFSAEYHERRRGRRRSLRSVFQRPAVEKTAWSFSAAGRSGSAAMGSSTAMAVSTIRSMTAPSSASFESK